MRILGLDYGLARIGVAVSDPTATIATPHAVIATKNHGEQTARVAEIAATLGVERIVVGMPYRDDGAVGDMAQRAQKFAAKVALQTGIEVVTWDERYTSLEAERIIRANQLSARRQRREGKGVIDKVAASVLLQDYLDAQAAR